MATEFALRTKTGLLGPFSLPPKDFHQDGDTRVVELVRMESGRTRTCRFCGDSIESRGMVSTHAGRKQTWIHVYTGDVRCSSMAAPARKAKR